MTVAQLIDALRALPQDALVIGGDPDSRGGMWVAAGALQVHAELREGGDSVDGCRYAIAMDGSPIEQREGEVSAVRLLEC